MRRCSLLSQIVGRLLPTVLVIGAAACAAPPQAPKVPAPYATPARAAKKAPPPSGAPTAASECHDLGGELLPGSDPLVRIAVVGRAVSMILPGADWCELPPDPQTRPYQRRFVDTASRVAAQRRFPFLHPIGIPLVLLEVALVLPPPGESFGPAKEVRAGVEYVASRMTEMPCTPPPEDLCGASRFLSEVGPVDPATGSFAVSVTGELPSRGHTPPNRSAVLA